VLTGLHGAHVTGGIIWLLSLFGLSTQGRLAAADSEKVEIAGLYWHFVDVIWIVIFTVIYLVPK
jgi:cytochrome c oxidase subunit 3/cytochrome o ubiquinol oxidase subunit 3